MGCLHTSPPSGGSGSQCIDSFGCPPGVCPDFIIKRHDTFPPFKIEVEDESGPINLSGLVLEASMWAFAKLKLAVTSTDTELRFVNNIGFHQVLVGDLIAMDRVRTPEFMKVTGFDEAAGIVKVQRGVSGTTASAWPRGTRLRIFRAKDIPAATEMVVQDVPQIDGTVLENQLMASYFVYEWAANDTCVPGCFWMEFKLLKMATTTETPSVTPLCYSGAGVEWVRRFPLTGDGFLIRIEDSPTAEM